MESLKRFIGSVIVSSLGPKKSNKVVVDDKDVYITKCPLQLLQQSDLRDPLSCLIEQSLFAHHEQFGCSSLSLLAMWYLWRKEFLAAIADGCQVGEVVRHSQKALEDVISALPEIIKDTKRMLLSKKEMEGGKRYLTISVKRTTPENKYTPLSISMKSKCVIEKLLSSKSSIPLGIAYSSRHYSPSQYRYDEDVDNTDHDSSHPSENDSQAKHNKELHFKEVVTDFVKNLSHDDTRSAELICDIWVKQAVSESSLKFNVDGIVICPLTLPCSYSSVVDGLLLKPNLNFLHNEDLTQEGNAKTLIIKGSITFEYVHLGFSPKVEVITHKTSEEMKLREKDIWIEKCCSVLSELQINILLVKGEVDSALQSFCAAHSIILICRIPWTTIKALCRAVNVNPCTYLSDCDANSIVSCINVKKWNGDCLKLLNDTYFNINVTSKGVQLHTVVLCHPSSSFLQSLEHQFWHVASRVKLAVERNKVLPGGGKTEEWCCRFLKKGHLSNTAGRVTTAVANGFHNYYEIISRKITMTKGFSSCEALDEMQSKVQAWRSAMALTLTMLQCDAFIINGCDNTTIKDVNFESNIIGFL